MIRKIFLEGGWTQKRLFDIGWSDVSLCQACQMVGGHREAQAAFHNEELKEGIWLEPALALLRKKTKEAWTKKASK